MMVNGRTGSTMVWVHFYGLMEVFIRVNGETVGKTVGVSFRVRMAQFMKVSGWMASIMGEENFKPQTVKFSQALLKMASSWVD